MKLFSDASEYALRAVVWLAQYPGEHRKVKDIAIGTQAAAGYLIKVLQGLMKAGILTAQRGSNGGFALQRDPATLSVYEVVQAIDPIERIRTCPLGLSAHGKNLCPMHKRIDDAIASIEANFRQCTIQQLLDEPSTSIPLGIKIARNRSVSDSASPPAA